MTADRQKFFRWALLLLSGVACLLVFVPFVLEIVSAVFFAFALFPLTRSLSHKKYFHHRGWVAVTLICFILAISLPVVLLGYSIFKSVNEVTSEGFRQSDLYQDLVQAKTYLLQLINHWAERFNLSGPMDLRAFANQFLTGFGGKIMSVSASVVSHLPDDTLSLFIFCCALYFFLAEGRKIRFLLLHNKLLPSHELDALIPLLQKSCFTTLWASLLVGFIQACTVAIGAAILSSNHAFLILLVTFIFSFIPVIGAAPVALFLAFLSFVKGQAAFTIGYIIVAILAGTVDNLIRPWLVRGEEKVHPLVMLLAIIGAILLFGIPGLFLGPMFVTAAMQVFSLYVFNEKTAAGLDLKSDL